ncbi:MAG: hypothetical protein H6842_00980 [Rhodospirillaceae bacterium]|nr:hypothetical protein [Rhodospirillaceae bacterium]
MRALRGLAVVAAAVVACTLAAAVTATGAGAQTVPSVLIGDWDGWGRQGTGSRWSIAVTVTPSGARIDYPSLNCGGVLELLTAEKMVARFHERLTYGLEGCIDGGQVELRVTPEGGLSYRWWYLAGEDSAQGALERRR